MGIIYKITNTANDKIYIGMTRKTLGERKARHLKDCANINCRSYNYKLYQAMRKIGVDKFKFEKIEECPDNELPGTATWHSTRQNSSDQTWKQYSIGFLRPPGPQG